MNFAEAIFLQR